jgi:signal transduction histidine kinase
MVVMANSPTDKALAQLARRLADRRAIVLESVRARVIGDPQMRISISLSRQAFLDHLPQLLGRLERRLLMPEAPRTQDRMERRPAEKHGEHRWEEGYSLVETLDEWRHLDECLRDELVQWCAECVDVSVQAALSASAAIAAFIGEGMHASAHRYAELQRAEASRRAGELQAALEEVRTLEFDRVSTWRQALHDVRGRVGAISNASTLVKRPDASLETQQRSLEALEQGLVGLREMLNELTGLARLEAKAEPLRVSTFDISELLNGLGTSLQPTAVARGLLLETDGPERLEVQGDPVKVQRIAQNLLQNALKYTDSGGVSVHWCADPDAPDARWILSVEDTGGGLEPGAGQRSAPGVLRTESEGLGLAIVRRLCELLQARLAIETASTGGTAVRVIFPSRY